MNSYSLAITQPEPRTSGKDATSSSAADGRGASPAPRTDTALHNDKLKHYLNMSGGLQGYENQPKLKFLLQFKQIW